METPCVKVERERGEAARTALADRGLLDSDHEIESEGGWLYIPVSDPEGIEEFEISYRDVAARDRQTTPGDLLGEEPSYERLGDVVILHEEDAERARAIARAVVDSDLPVSTVVNRASEIRGELRVREWDVLEGESTETVHREYGLEYALDLSTVYFSPRLATERRRVTEQVREGERVFDMFAGVGPFAIPAAARDAEVVAVDLNGRAVKYLKENAHRNGVADRVTAISGDVREVAPRYEDWADRVIMNLPHSADEFLESAVALCGEECVIHFYDIQSDEDPFGPGERAIRAVADPEYEVTVEERREVRSYAPHELNVCLDVRLVRT
ncbi:class I SAM-dependent methyltransferase [Natronorarus salvus]|uniref:class I SAM-dependent methyltransferase n=1 Tax=Natronorarus salvus TaxID=3117733 RepID=UPI002F266007